MRNISNGILRENHSTPFVVSSFFPPENSAFYEIMSKIVVEPEGRR
jgi:hypothetical protein